MNNHLKVFLRRIDWHLPGIVAFFLFVTIFYSGINYNGPFIDESFYSYAPRLGNVFYITGDVRLWPELSNLANIAGGFLAARLLSAIFGAATAAFIYQFARMFVRKASPDVSERKAAFYAAIIFSASAPVVFANTIAGYDSLSFMLLSLGLWLTAKGFDRGSGRTLILAAFSLAMAAASRYVTHLYLPVAALIGLYFAYTNKRYWLLQYLWGGMIFFSGLYWAFEHRHILAAVAHARNDALQVLATKLSYVVIIKEVFWRGGPAVVLALAEMSFCTYRLIWRKENLALGETVIFFAGFPIILYHLASGNNFAMNRNLYLAVMFLSIPAGIFLCRISEITRKLQYIIVPVIIFSALNLSARPLKIDRQWPDWRPVITAAKDLGLGSAGSVWSTARGGNLGNVWLLRSELGVNVDYTSPWKAASPEDLVSLAHSSGVEVIVGPFPSHDLKEGSLLGGYRVIKAIPVTNGPKAYILIKLER
ncbi:MAG: hypothetical protein COV46_07095 [Deltaproteobacteria bacterium CG11_big_fil_rev_8_21_14_0_20_49_13]|nr:MAG: hypothetical protein COV46_07095 [Deltaproteobacteria bacterium CG11_big_fil_rev_8_21_14_0_20_49_13]